MNAADILLDADRHVADGDVRGVAATVVAVSGMIALPAGAMVLWLVKDQLHIACSIGQPGTEGGDTWTCADGIGYLGVAVTLGAMWFLAVLAGSLIAGLVRHERTARIILVLLAGASTAWVLGWTWYGANELVGDDYAPLKGVGYWEIAVWPAAIVSATSLAIAVASLFLRGRTSRIVCAVASLGLVIATGLQPGLSVNTVPAAGLLAAAALRTARAVRE